MIVFFSTSISYEIIIMLSDAGQQYFHHVAGDKQIELHVLSALCSLKSKTGKKSLDKTHVFLVIKAVYLALEKNKIVHLLALVG